MTNLCRASALCALAVLSLATAYSQAVNATVVGTVTDSTGAVVVNAKVTLTESNTNISRTGLANDSGNFVFADVPPGTYTVTAEMAGFNHTSVGQPDFSLTIRESRRVVSTS